MAKNALLVFCLTTVLICTVSAKTKPDVFGTDQVRSTLIQRLLDAISDERRSLISTDDLSGNGIRVVGHNGPSIHVKLPSLDVRYCPEGRCEYFIEVSPLSIGSDPRKLRLCTMFDIYDEGSLSFSYGDFPEMQPDEEYEVEVCLVDRNGPLGQQCHPQLPCEVHHVKTGDIGGGPDATTEDDFNALPINGRIEDHLAIPGDGGEGGHEPCDDNEADSAAAAPVVDLEDELPATNDEPATNDTPNEAANDDEDSNGNLVIGTNEGTSPQESAPNEGRALDSLARALISLMEKRQQ